jgi:hypothetical protein
MNLSTVAGLIFTISVTALVIKKSKGKGEDELPGEQLDTPTEATQEA